MTPVAPQSERGSAPAERAAVPPPPHAVAATRDDRRQRFAWVLIYAAAMGWFEAVVVVYIRGLLGIARDQAIPPADEVMRRIESIPWLLHTEQGREIATMVMLVGVAILAARTRRARFGAWLVIFGAWDITYYIALRVLIGFPKSLATMDLLFLIPPHPWWYQPVALPIGISCVMIAVGVWLFYGPEPDPARARA